jgi:oligopeptide/dipeptide ABC transporter ATP-binding protein
MAAPLLDVRNVSRLFGRGAEAIHAVRDVSLAVHEGECLAIVGESGSGKTTLARMIVGLQAVSEGSVTFEGADVGRLAASRRGRMQLSRRIQMVFQDTHGSLDPKMRIGDIIAEPLHTQGWAKADIAARVAEVLHTVGISADFAARNAASLSGGQRQRVGIARALASRPAMLLLDEPVASLDVSIQGQILTLLKDIQARNRIAILIIAHDLAVVRAIADRTIVMYLGRAVEIADTAPLFDGPAHPYTAALLRSVSAEGRRSMPEAMAAGLARDPLPPTERAAGCLFRSRCWRAIERCALAVDEVTVGRGHRVACNVPLPAAEPRQVAAQ